MGLPDKLTWNKATQKIRLYGLRIFSQNFTCPTKSVKNKVVEKKANQPNVWHISNLSNSFGIYSKISLYDYFVN